MDQLTFLSQERPANPSLSRDSVVDWMTTVATWPLSFVALLGECAPAGSAGRMSLASFPWTKGQPSVPSLEHWRNLGMAWHGECLTLNTSEWNHTLAPSRSDGSVCSLSDILETGDHLSRYCLSPKACAGILRRAEKRGRALPEPYFKRPWNVWRSRQTKAQLRNPPSRLRRQQHQRTERCSHGRKLTVGRMGRLDFESETFLVAHALTAEGADASEDGTGRGPRLVASGPWHRCSGEVAAYRWKAAMGQTGAIAGDAGCGALTRRSQGESQTHDGCRSRSYVGA